MPALRAVPVTLTASERALLKKRARGAKTAHRDRQRAQIVLLAARDLPTAVIARRLGITQDTVRKWRGRFAARGPGGLADAPRTGRPRRISALERAAICALACQLPAATGVPLSRWTGPELAAELASRSLTGPVSASSVLRILAGHPVKPWQYQSWIFPRDPDFAARAAVILDLYQGYYQGRRLRPGDRIISVDAGPSIQARGRRHPTAPPASGQPMRVEHEYQRNGALALLAALDVHTGTVAAAATPPTTGIAPFMDLMGKVMSAEPYASAPRVFVIVDNGSDHRGKKAARRLRAARPNAIMIHTPVHASWLNQVEIFFSIIQKKVISPNDFASTGQLAATLLAFTGRYNQTARPFNWKYWGAPDLPDSGSTKIHFWTEDGLQQNRRKYSPEFRDEAVKSVIETSRPIAQVARELGIVEGTLGNWVNAYRKEHAGDEPELTVSERARLRELEREVRELRMKAEFLGKAAAFFAQEYR